MPGALPSAGTERYERCSFAVSAGLWRTAVSVGRALLALVLGLPLGVVPLALAMNSAGEALTSSPMPHRQFGHARLFPRFWSAEHVASLDDRPFYVWAVVGIWIRTLLAVIMPCNFIAMWRGPGVLFGSPLVVACVGGVCLFFSMFAHVWTFAEGHTYSVMVDYAFVAINYVTAWVLQTATVAAAAPAGTHRGRLLFAVALTVTPYALAHASVSLLVEFYFENPGIISRGACLCMITLVPGCAIEVIAMGARRLPGCPPQAAALMAWGVNIYALGNVQVIQTATPDVLVMALFFVSLAISEIFRHLCYLHGTTELDVTWRVVKALCQARSKAIAVAPIVPTEDAMGPAPDECDNNVGEGQPSGPEIVATRDQILMSIVTITNFTEIVVVFSVAATFLVSKINPLEVDAGPWPEHKTLAALAFALASELLGDFIVSAVAWQQELGRHGRYLSEEPRRQGGQLWWSAVIGASAMLITLDILLQIGVQLCPRPRVDGSGGLFVINHCD